jgi:hypothetical protein
MLKASFWTVVVAFALIVYFVVNNFQEIVIFGSTVLGFYILFKAANFYFDYLRKKYNV